MKVKCLNKIIKVVRNENSSWVYTLEEDVTYVFKGLTSRYASYFHKSKLIGVQSDDRLTILKGYSWNGISFFPDTDKTLKESLLHDFGYQFGELFATRRQIDKMFYLLRKQEGNWCPTCFYIILLSFGDLFFFQEPKLVSIEQTNI